MVKKEESIAKFVRQQIRKWEIPPAKPDRKPQVRIPVVTVSMEPGSGGSLVAPLQIRIQNVMRANGVKEEEARQRVIRREARRGAFVRKSYDADITDPENYDLTLNTWKMPIESAAEAVVAAVKSL